MASPFKQAFDQTPQAGIPKSSGSFGQDVPYDLKYPTVTLRDADQAMKGWFTANPIVISGRNDQPKKVPFMFSTAERWVMIQDTNVQGTRDKNGQLILPLLSIRRSGVEPVYERTVPADDMGVTEFLLYAQEYSNPQTGEKEYVLNAVLDRNVPILEVISILPPKIVRVTWDLSIWADMMNDLNAVIAHLILRFGNKHAIYVNENLWFDAQLTAITDASNDESIGQEQRIFKSSFQIVADSVPLISEDSIRRKKTLQALHLNIAESVMTGDEAKKLITKVNWYSPFGRRSPKF